MKHHLFKDGLALIVWLFGIVWLAWQPTQTEFTSIAFGLLLTFGVYFYLIWNGTKISLKWCLAIATIGRILVIPTFPNFSDDIYRFIWDGHLWHLGFNPFKYLPSEMVGQDPLLSSTLFNELNSKEYYSIYPPIPQFIFWLSTLFPSNQFLVEAFTMKAIHLIFDLGSIGILMKLLAHFKISSDRVLLYALNPLIIIELIANVHHEGIVIFFLLLMILFLTKGRIWQGGTCMAFAIGTKILPVLFCPLLFFYLKGRERWFFTGSVIFISALLFSPIWTDVALLSNFLDSADLYFRKFEFNGSLYYLYRALGYVVYGFNLIHVIGPVLTVGALSTILGIAYFKGSTSQNWQRVIYWCMISYSCYLLASMTVHPWYVAMLIPLSLFTKHKAPLIWSGLIMLTYINYSFEIYHEVMWIVWLEYLVVAYFFTKDHFSKPSLHLS